VRPEWWRALPALETWVPCGSGTHPVRWEEGALQLPAHPDAEGELVLAALGGEKAHCVELAEAWGRRAGDLEILSAGPRGAADVITISWDDVEEFRSSKPPGPAGRPHSQPMLPGSATGGVAASAGSWRAPGPAGGPAGPSPGVPMRHPLQAELEQFRAHHLDLLSLLALGPAFQMALSGTVAAAWSGRAPDGHRPALDAALNGRLAPAAATWLGMDPDRVDVRGHEGPGWGSLEVTGTGTRRRLHGSLPVGWLASVWACGLALAGGHLVVAVQRAAWPDATVLAVPEPGREPVPLTVRASGTPGDCAHWEVTGAGPGAHSDEAGTA
jgi:hypothetical protein